MSSKVFVVQRPAYYDRTTRGWVNKFDVSPAEEHGELVFMLGPGNIFHDRIEEAVRTLSGHLNDYSENDHLLAVGDPVAIAAAASIAANRAGGFVSVLKFDRHQGGYAPFKIRAY